MTTTRAARFHGFTVPLAAMLVACGGGGGSGETTAGIDRGGITIASGTVTGFGSVHVNGVRYSTTGATFTIDGQPGAESDLRVGHVVRIEGTVDASGTTGTARKVVFDDEVDGPVQAIDLANSRLTVVGRSVVVGSATSFDDTIVPRGLDGLALGDRVEVSGFVTAGGTVQATRIERKPAASTVEVKGTVSALDAGARHFMLGGLEVSYASAQLDGFATGQPSDGDRIEAFGTIGDGGVLVASRIEHEDLASGDSDDGGDYEGLITRFASAADFSVAGQRVTTTASTRFEGGVATDLALDVKVEVEGRFDAAGVLVATKIEFRRDGDTEFEGPVDAVNASAGTLVVLGITFRVDSVTRFEDHSDTQVERFGLADISAGDFVEVEAYDDGSGYLATRIERDDAHDEVQLEGRAENVAAPDFAVGGVAVTTDANTEFRDNNGVQIASSAFFQAAASGPVVKVRGRLLGNVVLAVRAELED